MIVKLDLKTRRRRIKIDIYPKSYILIYKLTRHRNPSFQVWRSDYRYRINILNI